VKYFNWNTEKNEELISDRGISFEEIVFCIMKDGLLDIIEHPNRSKYPDQKIFVVEVDEYVHLVPFIEDENEIFLKTIIPSRKMTKKYLGDKNESE
jgi:uncharacterized DUF497 family protein